MSNVPMTQQKGYFPRVKEAREALRDKALELYEKYVKIIDLALANGDYAVAAEHTKWLIEHMPAEEGVRMIDESAAKPKAADPKALGPSIQIGFALGGLPQPVDRLLPSPPTLLTPHIIDATPGAPDDVEE